jgi:linoleoyl-CoA desaturase
VNQLATISVDLLGGSSYVWARKHNIVHHTYTNIAGWDDDIAISPIGRISPHQEWRPFHRFQHLYLWPLYGLIPFKWYLVDDFRDVLRARIGEYRITRPRGWDLAVFVGGKLLFLVLAFLIPLTRHTGGTVVLAYVGVVLVEGFVLAIVFQMAHVVGEAAFPAPNPETGRMDSHWSVHQAETAVDYARDSRFVTWFVGGLNYQIEHHLLPHICHVHYPALAGLVEQTCREFGVGYLSRPTFRAAVVAHYRWLKQMGRGAADAPVGLA